MLKSHVPNHGFHIEGEQHYVETYSGEQGWRIGMHPEGGCDGPIGVELGLTATARALIAFEDALAAPDDDGSSEAQTDDMAARVVIPLTVEVSAQPLVAAPDLLVLATEVAAESRPAVPMSPTLTSQLGPLDAGEEYCLLVRGELWVSLLDICQMDDLDEVCEALASARAVCAHLADRVDRWMG